MSSILDWDSLEEDEKNPILQKALEANKALDTSAVEAEMNAEAEAREKLAIAANAGMTNQPSPNELVIPGARVSIGTKGIALFTDKIDYGLAKTAMDRAKVAVEAYSRQFTPGERIIAKNKRLINAVTDLNQLIPFKYSWAWSMYLDSSAAHWMPQEISEYAKDIEAYSTTYTPEQQRLISFFVVNYMYSQYIYPAEMLVNLYRLSTNPEIRQYILRQTFEEQVLHHSARHIIESFDLGKDDILKEKPREQIFKERNQSLIQYIGKLADMQTETFSQEEISSFVVALFTMYGGMRGLYHLTPMVQIFIENRNTGALAGTTANILRILRDFNRQWEFGIRYISGILNENPDALSNQDKANIVDMFEMLINSNIKLANNDQNTINEIEYVSRWFAATFLKRCGLDIMDTPTYNPQYESYIEKFKTSNSGTDHDNAPSSITASAGGSLGGWD